MVLSGNKRLQEMMDIMANERGATLFATDERSVRVLCAFWGFFSVSVSSCLLFVDYQYQSADVYLSVKARGKEKLLSLFY